MLETLKGTSRTVPRYAGELVGTFCAKEEMRGGLSGVLLEPIGENKVRLVATDGHRLIVTELPSLNADEFPQVAGFEPNGFSSVVVPRETFLSACKAAPKGRKALGVPILETVAVTTGDNKASLAVSCIDNGQVFNAAAVDGNFPAWSKVVPGDAPTYDVDDPRPGCRFGVNALYLAEACKALAVLADGPPVIVFHPPTGNEPMKLTTTTERGTATAVIMPMRV